MKITAINGSPKTAGISALIIKQMEKLLDEQVVKHHAIRLVHACCSIAPNVPHRARSGNFISRRPGISYNVLWGGQYLLAPLPTKLTWKPRW